MEKEARECTKYRLKNLHLQDKDKDRIRQIKKARKSTGKRLKDLHKMLY